MDYANLFLFHLSPRAMRTVKEIMPNWASSTPLHSKSQRKRIQQFLTATTSAEGCVAIMKLRVTKKFQGFTVNAFPSQLEVTTSIYKKGGGSPPLKKMNKCLGFSSMEHPWMQEGKIMGPFANNPRVKTKAETKYRTYCDCVKEHRAC